MISSPQRVIAGGFQVVRASITFSFAEQSQCVVALPENDQLSANSALSLSQLAGRRLIAPRNCAGAMKKR